MKKENDFTIEEKREIHIAVEKAKDEVRKHYKQLEKSLPKGSIINSRKRVIDMDNAAWKARQEKEEEILKERIENNG